MNKTKKILLTILIFLLFICGCSNNKEKKTYTNFNELNGEKIGVIVGTVFDNIGKNLFPDSEIIYYSNTSDMITGLKESKIEGFLSDYGIGVQTCSENNDLVFFKTESNYFDYSLMFQKTTSGEQLRNEFNKFLEEDDADYDAEYQKWATEKEYEYFDYESLPNTKGTIRVATDGQSFPFSFVADNHLTGLEIETIYRFCEKEGYGLEIDIYDFSGVLAAVSSNKAEIGASGICSTPERAEKYYFSNSYVSAGTVVVARKESIEHNFQSLSDLSNTDVSCISGTIYDTLLNSYAHNVSYHYFDTTTDEVNALIQGKVSATLLNSNLYDGLKKEITNLRIIDTVFVDNIGYIFQKSNEPSVLQIQLDSFINKLKQTGELNKIWDKWNNSDNPTVDYSDLKDINGTIRFAMSSSMGSPSNFIKDGKHCGVDIDVMVQFAREYGYDIEFQDYSFSGVLAAVSSGKADVGGSNITKNEERMKSMNFSEPYFTGYVYAVTIDQESPIENKSVLETLKTSFYKTFIQENRYSLFLSGIKTTLLITICSCICGTVLGFLLYIIFRNSNGVAIKLLNFYSWLITGLPTVVLLMIFYYVIFVKTRLSAEIISVISFSILFSLSTFSILKTCFMAIDKGQFEAGYALGYSKFKTITNIIIPEIAPMFFPSYRGEIVGLIKATSIVGYIAVQDLTKISDIVRSRTYEAFFPLIAITIIYFVIIFVLDIVAKRIEKCVNTKNRKPEDILKGVKRK